MERFLKSSKTIYLTLTLGFFLRLISLNQSLWLDEATTALVSKMNLQDIFTKFLPGDFHPPFYYLFMKFWVLLFGVSETSLRIPSVIFGLGIIFFVYLIAKKMFDIKTANIAALLTATSGLLIYYSQEARMYSLTALLAAAAFYLLIEKKWMFFSVSLLLLGLTDYVALLIIPVFLIISIKNIKRFILSLVPLLVGFVLWTPVFAKQLLGGFANTGNSWWNILGTLTFKNAGLIPVKFILGRISFGNHLVYAIVAGLSIILFGYLVVRSFKSAKKILLWLILPIVLGMLISAKVPILYYFRFIFCLPALYILVADGLESLGRKYFWGFLIGAILINIFSSGIYLSSQKFQREDWRGASQAIGENPLVMPGNSHEEAVIYYGKERNLTDINNLTGKEGKIWLSRYVWEITDPKDVTRSKIENLGYTKEAEYNFNGVIFWEYTKNLYAYID